MVFSEIDVAKKLYFDIEKNIGNNYTLTAVLNNIELIKARISFVLTPAMTANIANADHHSNYFILEREVLNKHDQVQQTICYWLERTKRLGDFKPACRQTLR